MSRQTSKTGYAFVTVLIAMMIACARNTEPVSPSPSQLSEERRQSILVFTEGEKSILDDAQRKVRSIRAEHEALLKSWPEKDDLDSIAGIEAARDRTRRSQSLLLQGLEVERSKVMLLRAHAAQSDLYEPLKSRVVEEFDRHYAVYSKMYEDTVSAIRDEEAAFLELDEVAKRIVRTRRAERGLVNGADSAEIAAREKADVRLQQTKKRKTLALDTLFAVKNSTSIILRCAMSGYTETTTPSIAACITEHQK